MQLLFKFMPVTQLTQEFCDQDASEDFPKPEGIRPHFRMMFYIPHQPGYLPYASGMMFYSGSEGITMFKVYRYKILAEQIDDIDNYQGDLTPDESETTMEKTYYSLDELRALPSAMFSFFPAY